MRLRTQIHSEKAKVYLEIESEWRDNDSYFFTGVWMDRNTVSNLISMLRQVRSKMVLEDGKNHE